MPISVNQAFKELGKFVPPPLDILRRDECPKEISQVDLEKLYIQNTKNRVVRFELNLAQKFILNAINKQLRETGKVRVELLKARQFGGSTFFCLVVYILMRDYGYKGVVMAQNLQAANNLFKKIKLAHKMDKQPRPEVGNKRELLMTTDGQVWVGSADAPDCVTSQTNQFLICTELALWPDQLIQMQSLLPTVHDIDGTFIIFESTARGIDNFFHDNWITATLGENDYCPVFVGWQHLPWLYWKDFVDADAKDMLLNSLDSEEKRLYEENVTLEQLNWRRWYLLNKCAGDVDLFHQEMPSNDSEAFLSSGRPVFDRAILEHWYRIAKKPVGEYIIRYMNASAPWQDICKGDPATLNECLDLSPNGDFAVWEMPVPFMNYEIGSDVSEGRSDGKTKSDSSGIYVMRRDTEETVARWYGKIHPEELADLLRCVGIMYNNAFICVEANNHGLTTLTRLEKIYQQSKIYRQESKAPQGPMMASVPPRLGWWSDKYSKAKIIDAAAYDVRKQKLKLNDREAIDELSRIEREANGNIKTTGKDRAMSIILMLEAHRYGQDFNIVPAEELSIPARECERLWKRDQRRANGQLALNRYYRMKLYGARN